MLDLKSDRPSKFKRNRRRKERRPRDWKKIFRVALRVSVALGSVALIVGGAVLGGRFLLSSDYFRIAAVRVESGKRVSAEEILALSDIRTGTSIFDVDLETVGKKIEENPWIASASVRRVFPQEVVIRVAERQPKAIINLGYLYYIDGAGEVFKVLEARDGLDFPVVTGIDRKYLLEQPAEARRLLAGAVALLESVEKRRLFGAKDLSEIHVDPQDGYRLHTLDGGVPIRMGFSGFDEKLARLERIYGELQPNLARLKYIDLNVADRVIVKVDKRSLAPGTNIDQGRG